MSGHRLIDHRAAAERVAALVDELIAAGVNGLDLWRELDARAPDTSIRALRDGLALAAARMGKSGYRVTLIGRGTPP